MRACYNLGAPKKPTNLTINSDLLAQAKNLNINMSAVLESALADKVKRIMQSDWLEENYFELFPDGEMQVMIKVGMPMELINNPGLLMAYYALTLQVSESPFVLAHTVNYGNLSSLNKMVSLIKVPVVNDQTADVSITLY